MADSFSLLVENVKDYAIFIIDPKGYIVSWNKGAENIKGYTAREIIGKHISIFYTAEDIKSNVPHNNLEEAAKGRYEDEGWRIKKDGTRFWANVVFTALYNPDKTLKGFAKITRDMTERKKIVDRQSYLASLLEITPDAIFSFNANNEILSWNKGAETMYGYKAGEVLHKNVTEKVRPQMDEPALNKLREEIKSKNYWKAEVIHLARNNKPLYVNISLAVKRDESNNIVEYVCICRDITAQKQAEENTGRLRDQIEKLTRRKLDDSLKETSDYKYALDKSSIVAITDQKGIITFVNDNFCKISGYSREELIGSDHRIVNSGHHTKEFIKNLWQTIAKGHVWKGEIKNKTKTGGYYWVATTIVPFLNDKGKPYQYVAIRADITQRKTAEAELHNLNEQLEERIKARTQELEAANKGLEAFSYSVSHDLRAPLRSIHGFSRILQEDYCSVLDDNGVRLLNKIMTNAGNMGRLIDDLLMFTKLGKQEIKGYTIDTITLVQQCLDELAQLTQLTKYNIQINQLPFCRGDVNMLKQVWLNLLGNAIKYSAKKAKPVITIGCNEEADRLVYFIKDNGAGFSMKYYDKLFGVFQRLHGNDDFEGTGVGLALVKLIIDKHHGNIWAKATPGRGATFYFSIPKTMNI